MIKKNPVRNVRGNVTDNCLVIDPIIVKGCPIAKDPYTVEDGLNEIARESGPSDRNRRTPNRLIINVTIIRALYEPYTLGNLC